MVQPVDILEKIVLIRLILEALALLPTLGQDLSQAMQEMHSSDPTQKKVANVAAAVAQMASSAATVLNGANPKKD